MAEYHRFMREVVAALEKATTPIEQSKRDKRRGIYNTRLEVLGLPVPSQRRLARRFSFYDESEEEILRTWDFIWNETRVFEAKSLALLYYQKRLEQLDPATYWPTLRRWAEKLDNWEHSDRLSHIYSTLLERDFQRLYPIYEQWNRSRNPWLRRQSVVGLLYYSAHRREYPAVDEILPLVENLLTDDDYYVQKGVGWTLREVGNVYPDEMLRFVEKQLVALSPVAFTSAVEKVQGETKRRLKEHRREQRKRQEKIMKEIS